jgi:predicted nucleic acid-binding protein
MAADPVFVDTNVLVYATRPSATQHAAALAALTRLEREGSALWVSSRVLREYLAAVTRPQSTAPGLAMATAIADVRNFRAVFDVAEERPSVLDRLLDLLVAHRSSGRQVHDANVVAAMLETAFVACSRSTAQISDASLESSISSRSGKLTIRAFVVSSPVFAGSSSRAQRIGNRFTSGKSVTHSCARPSRSATALTRGRVCRCRDRRGPRRARAAPANGR